MKRFLSLTLALALLFAYAVPANAAILLERGSRGGDVRRVQEKLIQWGYMTGTADGVYGQKTEEAVRLFQRRNGLTADGRVGPETAAAMGVTLRGDTTYTSSRSDAAILSQNHLLLAKLVYAEAKGETYRGMVAVAAVVLNRVASSEFPNTVSGVIYQSGAFDCVRNGSINNTPNNACIRAARDAMNGWDPTGGCLYYYNPATATSPWIKNLTVHTVIGRHAFAL